jgi:hypothetical protein
LYPEETRKLIKDGVDLMMKLLGKKHGSSTLTLKNVSDTPPDAANDQEEGAGSGNT